MLLNTVKKLFLPENITPVTVDDLFVAPDGWKLEQYMRQLVFVPCDMKKGGRNHGLIAEGAIRPEAVHPTCYTSDKFTFWKKDLGSYSYPVVLPEDYRPSGFIKHEVIPAQIKGELWSVRGQHIANVLDKHKNFGVQFIRERIPVRYPYREVGFTKTSPIPKISSDEYFTTVTAWMYIGLPEYWDSQIGGIFATSQMDTYEHDIPRLYVDKFYKFDI